MKELYNTTIELKALDKAKYDKIMDFLEENEINYEEIDFEEYELDTRTEEEKYEDWLSEQADQINDERKISEWT